METGQMATPFRTNGGQKKSSLEPVRGVWGAEGGGAILPIGGSGSCCLSTSFGASAAI